MKKQSKKSLIRKKIIVVIFFALALLLIALVFMRCTRDNVSKGHTECEKLEDKIVKEIERELNYCKTASDCVLLNGCPYGCNNLINKNADLQKFAEMNSEYTDKCSSCEANCRNALRSGEIDCVKKKCVSTRGE